MIKEEGENFNKSEISAEKLIKQTNYVVGKIDDKSKIKENNEKLGNEQVYDILTNNELSWQAIIYDLINSEQLDPWDIDLGLIANKYLEKIKALEEANFFVSSKVLLAASLLLRIKSEILLDRYIRSLDDILFGKKEEEKKVFERIEIDESETPELYMRTAIPRMRKVTLQELMTALNKAIKTESRRIQKEIDLKQAERETEIVFPKVKINIKDRIKKIYSRVLTVFKSRKERLSYTELIGKSKEERVISFLPLLHLDNQQKVWLEQEEHFDEIYIWLYKHYKKEQAEKMAEAMIEQEKKELAKAEKEEELAEQTGFDNLVKGVEEGL